MVAPPRPETGALRDYYAQLDPLLSAEGVLKGISVMSSITASVLYLGASCGATSGAAAGAALAAGAGAALLYAGAALQLPRYIPTAWFFADLIVSTVLGILLLVTSILTLVFCDSSDIVGFLRAPFGMLASATLVGSAGVTFAEVTRRWDAARPAREAPVALPTEQEA